MEQDYIYMEETTVKSSSEVRNVHIRIRSVVEGVENLWETTGEYKWDGRQHMLAYTDYTGNAITKNGSLHGGGKVSAAYRDIFYGRERGRIEYPGAIYAG